MTNDLCPTWATGNNLLDWFSTMRHQQSTRRRGQSTRRKTLFFNKKKINKKKNPFHETAHVCSRYQWSTHSIPEIPTIYQWPSPGISQAAFGTSLAECNRCPYKSDKPDKKYYIVTENDIIVYFGAAGMSDFTIHKMKKQKTQRQIHNRHRKMNLNFGINQE